MRVLSSDDVSAGAGFVGVGENQFIGNEVRVTLDGKSEVAAGRGEFREADVAEFGLAHAEIAEAEGETAE